MKTRKGCWTCRDRKIHCDGGLPVCQKCVGAQRECRGYEPRLSWPRKDDKKRTMAGPSPPAAVRPPTASRLFFINATYRDVQVYRHLSHRLRPLPSIQYCPAPWAPPQVDVNPPDLVRYFHDAAHHSLVTFDKNTPKLRDILLSMVMPHGTAAGSALLYALLAFSALRRSGLHQQALELKIAALQTLSASAEKGPLPRDEAVRHLATSMLLGSFETLLPSGHSDEWLRYLWGAMDVIQATRLADQPHGSDVCHLLDWFHYHESLSRFSLHLWPGKPVGRQTGPGLPSLSLARHRPAPPSPNPSYAILNLLSEACETLLDPWDPRSRTEDYRDRLRALNERIGDIHTTPQSVSAPDPALAVEVYQTATRIYLVRAAQSSWEPSAGLDDLVERALALPARECTCTHFFPLFIVACEARTDEQRAAILSLIGRAEESKEARNMAWVIHAIQSVWVHQDLHADGDLVVDYLGMISAAIGSSNTLPSFV
ncbi:hypothetical protein VTK73DRAFT_6351 [Phialemonium thermophilum]|uniref:Zn(2)-C6 fungal-type domain-containing protein n=1 Tax=Phialemonium thermophilum TaxID=223376 RepID=A0ABR3WJS2_9PEZI